MTQAIATRLLWKEYRQQRSLWLALLLGATFLQLLFWFFIERSPGANLDLLPLHLGVAVGMTGFFAACSSAISFAIEREDGTHLRLVSLSCPAGMTLGLKFLTGILGALLLLGLSATVGVLLTTGFRPALNVVLTATSQDVLAGVLWIVLLTGGGQVVGALCSMLCRTVLPAVISAIVGLSIGFTALISIWTAQVLRPGPRIDTLDFCCFAVGSLTLLTVIGSIDFLLVHWWINRGFPETAPVGKQSLFRRIRVRHSDLDGSVVLEIGGQDRTASQVLTHEQACVLPAPRWGLRLLHDHWGRGRTRILRFLCWKEAAASRRTFQILIGVALLLAILSGIESSATGPYRRGGPWQQSTIAFGCLSIFVCGLMTFRGEQSRDSYRLLAGLGASPNHVWLSKQIIWFGRLLMTVATVLALVVSIAGMRPLAVGLPQTDGPSRVLWWLLEAGTVLTAAAVFFSIAQMASLMWRRTSLSVFFALLCSSLMLIWTAVSSHFNVPIAVSGLPLVPALLLSTRLRTPGWMVDDDRPRRWIAPAVAATSGLAACWLCVGVWRILEIPAPVQASRPGASRSPADEGSLSGLTADQRATVLKPVSDEEAGTARLYEQLGSAGNDTLDAVRRAAARADCAFASPATEILYAASFARTHMPDNAERLLAQAKNDIAAGRTDDALKLHRDALAIARHAAGRGTNGDYGRWQSITVSTLQSLVEWAASDDVSPALIDQADELLAQHLAAAPDLFAVSCARHQVMRNTLHLPVRQHLAWRRRAYTNDEFFFQIFSLRFPGTRARCDRLVDWFEDRTASLLAQVQQIRSQQPLSDKNLWGWLSEHMPNVGRRDEPVWHEWLRTTPLANGVVSDLAPELILGDTTVRTELRGTAIAMRLQLARRMSGTLPASLDETGLPAAALVDPWTGGSFTWYPEGIPDAINGTDPPIPADTPFLLSSGANGGRIELVEEMVAVEGPFDPPPNIIPLKDGDGGGAALQNRNEPPAMIPVAPDTNGGFGAPAAGADGGFSADPAAITTGSLAAGMGDPEVRWETRRRYVLVHSNGARTRPAFAPRVWLFPADNQSDSNQSDSNQSDSNQSDSNQSDSNQSDSNQPDSNQPDSSQPDSNPPDSSQTAGE